MSLREPKDELSDAVEAAQDKAVGQETIRYRKKGRGGAPAGAVRSCEEASSTQRIPGTGEVKAKGPCAKPQVGFRALTAAIYRLRLKNIVATAHEHQEG